MPHRCRLLTAAVLVALLTACGSDDDDAATTDTTVVTPQGTAAATPVTTGTADTVADTATSPATTAAPATGSDAGGNGGTPTDPCALLTPEQVALVLTDPGPGEGQGAAAGPFTGCEWSDASDLTALELFVADIGSGTDNEAATDEAFAARFEPDVLAGMTTLDIGTRAVAGPEGDDVVAYVVTPDSLFQLRLWGVGAGPRPAERWGELQPAMEQLARAVVANAGD